MKEKILLISFISIGYCSFCQSLYKDTIELYHERVKVINPNLDKIDSLNLASEFNIDWKDCPTYYFLESNDSITLENKISTTNKGNFNNYSFCEIESDWRGKIISIKIIAYTEKPKNEEFKKFFNEIKVEPLKKFGYKVGSKCTYKIKHE